MCRLCMLWREVQSDNMIFPRKNCHTVTFRKFVQTVCDTLARFEYFIINRNYCAKWSYVHPAPSPTILDLPSKDD